MTTRNHYPLSTRNLAPPAVRLVRINPSFHETVTWADGLVVHHTDSVSRESLFFFPLCAQEAPTDVMPLILRSHRCLHTKKKGNRKLRRRKTKNSKKTGTKILKALGGYILLLFFFLPKVKT